LIFKKLNKKGENFLNYLTNLSKLFSLKETQILDIVKI